MKDTVSQGSNQGNSPPHTEQWDSVARIEVLVSVLRTFDPAPESMGEVDVDDLRRWAARAFVATRRLGRYTSVEAQARANAAAYVAMRHREDEDAGRPRANHFEAGLRVYHKVLESGGEPLSAGDDDQWHLVKVQDVKSGRTLSLDFVCPEHYHALSERLDLPCIRPGRIEAHRDRNGTVLTVRRMSTTAHECLLCEEGEVEAAIEDAWQEIHGGGA